MIKINEKTAMNDESKINIPEFYVPGLMQEKEIADLEKKVAKLRIDYLALELIGLIEQWPVVSFKLTTEQNDYDHDAAMRMVLFIDQKSVVFDKSVAVEDQEQIAEEMLDWVAGWCDRSDQHTDNFVDGVIGEVGRSKNGLVVRNKESLIKIVSKSYDKAVGKYMRLNTSWEELMAELSRADLSQRVGAIQDAGQGASKTPKM